MKNYAGKWLERGITVKQLSPFAVWPYSWFKLADCFMMYSLSECVRWRFSLEFMQVHESGRMSFYNPVKLHPNWSWFSVFVMEFFTMWIERMNHAGDSSMVGKVHNAGYCCWSLSVGGSWLVCFVMEVFILIIVEDECWASSDCSSFSPSWNMIHTGEADECFMAIYSMEISELSVFARWGPHH